ncbi:MAG: IclR family transcriptional regulator, partial [Mycobacteriales bacterium]
MGGSAATTHATLGSERVAGTQAIGRALAVLRLFRERAEELGIMQVAQAVGLTPSTTHRIVRALAAEGYLTQSGVSDRYSLGREAVLLGVAAQRNLGLHTVQPVLERVAAQTGESVNLGVRDGSSALVLLRIQSSQPLRFDQPPGTRVPLHASSIGKALLAFGSDPVATGKLPLS